MDTTVKPQDTNGSVTASPVEAAGLQPFLHDAVVTLHAPSLVVSRADGQLSGGADGFYHGDRRALSRLSLAVEGVPLAPIGGGLRGADRAEFRSILRGLGEVTPDPAVALRHRRTTEAGRLEETFEITNAGIRPVLFRLTVTVGTDLAPMEQVKSGRFPALAPGAGPLWPGGIAAAEGAAGDVTWSEGVTGTVEGAAGHVTWSAGDFTARLTASPAPTATDLTEDAALRLSYDIGLAPGEAWSLTLTCAAGYTDGDQFPPPPAGRLPWSVPALRSADRALDRWLEQSMADLDRLRLTDAASTDPARPDQFLAAGAPWFLTLFGRDALWAARMLLPLGTELAAGTLRTLARRQGAVTDPATEEQPGKILHEVRRASLHFSDELSLPPVYYGTVDATPLWITLLHDAWRWGLPEAEVADLLPHAEAALAWMREQAAGDGFLKYVDQTGHGLSNQGWKDSQDSIRHRDGRLATTPIALCEVQAYAYEAARGGAALLRAFGRPGAEEWERWAEELADRFRARFWVEDERGRYPAVALDGEGRPVDSATSGFGHLLGTGLLDDEESALLAARLAAPDLDSGHGLRTLSTESVGFNPYGYHIGSIWPHDTAIAVRGLVRAGFPDAAASLSQGLLTASASTVFAARLPELFAGHGTGETPDPAPYPASCRPQAWAAAAAVAVLQSALGLEANAPEQTLTLTPSFAPSYGPLTLTGLRIGQHTVNVTVAPDGAVTAGGGGGGTIGVRAPGRPCPFLPLGTARPCPPSTRFGSACTGCQADRGTMLSAR